MKRVLASAVGAGFVFVGVGALVAPKRLAAVFGLPSADATALAFVRAACARDLILGGGSLVGLGDAVLVGAVRGIRPQLALHVGGFVVVAALALAMGPDDPAEDARPGTPPH